MQRSRIFPTKEQLRFGTLEVVEWMKREGDRVDYGEIIARLKLDMYGVIKYEDLTSNCVAGKLIEIDAAEGFAVCDGEAFCVIEWCEHKVSYHDLCSVCGADLKQTSVLQPERRTDLLVGGGDMTLQLNHEALVQQSKENTIGLLKSKKLLLVVDIDHTILHATRDQRIGQLQKLPEFQKETHAFKLYKNSLPYYIKLRPGLQHFLERLHPYFDMRIYTMALRNYSSEILKVIDPDGKYFGNKIVCRDDHKDNESFKDLFKMCPVDGRMFIIVDDRVDVWKSAKKNVVQVLKFNFFAQETVQTGPAPINKTALPPLDVPLNFNDLHVRDKDNVLETTANVLLAIHHMFYGKLSLNELPQSKKRPKVNHTRNKKSPRSKRARLADNQEAISPFEFNLASEAPSNSTSSGPSANTNSDSIMSETTDSNTSTSSGSPSTDSSQAGSQNNAPSVCSDVDAKMKESNSEETSGKSQNETMTNSQAEAQSKSESAEVAAVPVGKREACELDALPKPGDQQEVAHNEWERIPRDLKDVRILYRKIKKTIFKGLIFVFSGVFALDVPPESQEIWKRVIRYGGKCVKTLSVGNPEGVTHVVAGRGKTKKVVIGLKTEGILVVNPFFVDHSVFHYVKALESLFPPDLTDPDQTTDAPQTGQRQSTKKKSKSKPKSRSKHQSSSRSKKPSEPIPKKSKKSTSHTVPNAHNPSSDTGTHQTGKRKSESKEPEKHSPDSDTMAVDTEATRTGSDPMDVDTDSTPPTKRQKNTDETTTLPAESVPNAASSSLDSEQSPENPKLEASTEPTCDISSPKDTKQADQTELTSTPNPSNPKSVSQDQKPGSQSQKPDNQSQKPDTQPQKPDTKPQKPDTKPQKPDTQPQKPDNQSQKPDTQAQKPDTKPQKPDTKPQKPDTKPPKPDTQPQKPDTQPQKPDTQPQKPSHGSQKPDPPEQTPKGQNSQNKTSQNRKSQKKLKDSQNIREKHLQKPQDVVRLNPNVPLRCWCNNVRASDELFKAARSVIDFAEELRSPKSERKKKRKSKSSKSKRKEKMDKVKPRVEEEQDVGELDEEPEAVVFGEEIDRLGGGMEIEGDELEDVLMELITSEHSGGSSERQTAGAADQDEDDDKYFDEMMSTNLNDVEQQYGDGEEDEEGLEDADVDYEEEDGDY